MSETKILYVAVPRGEARVPVVSREEWTRIFSEYPDSLRYHAANLAAHNWDVVMIKGRILVACPWSGGHWIEKDGSRHELTSEELDAFYPRTNDPNARWNSSFSYDRDISGYREKKIVISAATTPAASGASPSSTDGGKNGG